MRRKEKEITDTEQILGIIEKGEICRLGLCSNDVPYIVPLNYGYSDGHLYFHCAKAGRKLEIINSNNRACFEIDVDAEMTAGEHACSFGMTYKSVIGYGRIMTVDDVPGKRKGLSVIMEHYTGKAGWDFADSEIQKVLILKMKIEEMTGKKSA